jgi:hypothetical protein
MYLYAVLCRPFSTIFLGFPIVICRLGSDLAGLRTGVRPCRYAGWGSDLAGMQAGGQTSRFAGWGQTSRVCGLGSDLAGLRTGVRPRGLSQALPRLLRNCKKMNLPALQGGEVHFNCLCNEEIT